MIFFKHELKKCAIAKLPQNLKICSLDTYIHESTAQIPKLYDIYARFLSLGKR